MLRLESLEYNDFSQYSSEMVQITSLVLYRRGLGLLHIEFTRFKKFNSIRGLANKF